MSLEVAPLPSVPSFQILNAENLDPVQLLIREFSAGSTHVIIECYGKCWSVFFRHSTPCIWKFLASMEADYLTDKLARPHEQKKNRDRAYLVRVAQAVIHGAQTKIHQEAAAASA